MHFVVLDNYPVAPYASFHEEQLADAKERIAAKEVPIEVVTTNKAPFLLKLVFFLRKSQNKIFPFLLCPVNRL